MQHAIEPRRDENGSKSALRLRARSGARSSVEAQPHERAAVPGVLRLHGAAVRLGDLADDREAEPGARHRREPRPSGRSGRRRGAGPRRRIPARGRAPAARRRERDLDRAAFAAPLAGVLEQVPDGPLHPVAVRRRRRSARAERSATRRSGKRVRARSTRVLDELVELELLPLELARRRWASSSRPAMRPRISCDSRWRSSSRRLRCSGSSSMSPRRTSMFVCRLVSGVRSSCEASATKRRCVSSDSSSEASIVLKDAAEARELVLSALGNPLARLARLGDPLGRRGQAAYRSERRARDERAGRRGDGDPPERDEDEDEPQPLEGAIRLLQVLVRDHRAGRAEEPRLGRDELAEVQTPLQADCARVTSRKKPSCVPAATARTRASGLTW